MKNKIKFLSILFLSFIIVCAHTIPVFADEEISSENIEIVPEVVNVLSEDYVAEDVIEENISDEEVTILEASESLQIEAVKESLEIEEEKVENTSTTSDTISQEIIFIQNDLPTTTEEIVLEEENISEEEVLKESKVTIHIRYNDQIVASSSVNFVASSTIDIVDNSSTTRAIPSDSVLATLKTLDEENTSFSISNLGYYSSFDSYIINCLNIIESEATTTNACNEWQYVVNGSYPFVGVDDYVVSNGDNIYFYFGSPRRLSFATSTGFINENFEVLVEAYDYEENLWEPLVGSVVGATQPDPLNPWSPIEIATSTSDTLGKTFFNLYATGTYAFGLQQDYYFPSYEIIFEERATTSTPTTGGSTTSSGGSSTSHNIPNIETMLSFLDSKQLGDGSFGADLYTDWAAVAYGSASGHDAAKEKLKIFLKNDVLDGGVITDYERRAMAMLSLGLNPYTEGKENYIKKITDSFDGNQIGDASLYNDDIFGIIVLLNAGYNTSEEIITKSAEYVVSKQASSGEWDSIDVTSAGIQALSLAQGVSGASEATSRGIDFLKNSQVNDGGFYNAFSTSWAAQGFLARSIDPQAILKNNLNPFDYLYSKQQADGGLELISSLDSNRVWSTAYAVPAVGYKTWDNILINVSKPSFGDPNTVIKENNNLNGTSTTTATSTVNILGAETSTTSDSESVEEVFVSRDEAISFIENNGGGGVEIKDGEDVEKTFVEEKQKNSNIAGVGDFSFKISWWVIIIIILGGFIYYYVKRK